MAGILRNVVIHPAPAPRAADGTFRVVSRSDGKTALPPPPPPPPGPRRSPPQRCPLCGTTQNSHPGLFRTVGELFECTVCHTKINETGTIVAQGVE